MTDSQTSGHFIPYGQGDATLQAVGGLSGLTELVTRFYQIMEHTPEYRPLFDMHPENIPLTIDKLVSFLSGWMGGERLYAKKYGKMHLPQAHAHLVVTDKEKTMWLNCMSDALEQLNYSGELKSYLLKQLAFPAERIQQVSAVYQNTKNA
ncbi:group II truncated hemoglobin [Marinomonas epiphytica]